MHLVDLADPLAPKPSTRGTGGGSTVQVQSDPVDVVVDPASGYAFVANRTSHSISVLDASGEEVKVIQPWPEWTLTSARFRDRDASGSTAEFALLGAVDGYMARCRRWAQTGEDFAVLADARLRDVVTYAAKIATQAITMRIICAILNLKLNKAEATSTNTSTE